MVLVNVISHRCLELSQAFVRTCLCFINLYNNEPASWKLVFSDNEVIDNMFYTRVSCF